MNYSKQKIGDQIRKAESLVKKKKLPEAKNIYLEILKLNSENHFVIEKLADICIQQQHYDQACAYFSKLERLDSTNVLYLCNFAFSLDKLGQFDLALQVLDRAKKVDPSEISVYYNETVSLCNLKRYEEARFAALTALKLQPFSATSLNNLGAVLQKLGDYTAAKSAFQASIEIEPKYLDPRINLAGLHSINHEYDESRLAYENIHTEFPSLPEEILNLIKVKSAYEYLRIGNFSKGWEYYELALNKEIPFENSRNPKRSFIKPRWNGENLKGRKLLIWAEQGVGDEIAHGTCIPDLIKLECNIIIECDPRLVEAFRRSFPSCAVRASSYNRDIYLSAVYNDYDYQIPFGSLMRFFRNNLEDFKKSLPYIITDKDAAQKYEDRLNELSAKKFRIGISWRSGLLHAERNTAYTSIMDWAPIFSLPNIEFVNLQYGDCEHELTQAEQEFKIRIIRWDDLDLKNDIDITMSLISRLDCVITVANAVSSMAPAIGVPTLLLCGKMPWDHFGTNYSPIFPLITPFSPKNTSIQAESLIDIATYISEILK